MARTPARTYRCQSCDARPAQWTGRCAKCGEFGTINEVESAAPAAGRKASARAAQPVTPARPVTQVRSAGPAARLKTGANEFDRVLSGGLVAGQVLLCSGPPGSGKSTLLLAVADSLARREKRQVLYISGEESVEQIALRAARIGAESEYLLLADDTELSQVLGHIDQHGDDLAMVIIDSVQTIASADVEGRAGGVTQVMEVASVLTKVAKKRGLPMVLIGQVTKDSVVAGPRALEHIVDTTLSLDGDKHTALRLLRTVKNRFGSLEVAAFEQTDAGLVEVIDPSVLFRTHRAEPVPGTCVTVTVEGHRPLMAEIQGLVSNSTNPNPRRGFTGLDSVRSSMLVAVTESVTRLRLSDKDVFLATLGGIRVTEPGADLAACLALYSAAAEAPIALDLAAIGEVTLSGDIRQVPMITERVTEAFRLGYRRVMVPNGTRERMGARAKGGKLLEVPTLVKAIESLPTTYFLRNINSGPGSSA